MGYERLRVAKPMKQLVKAVELHTRHIPKENRGQWREAKMLAYGCLGNLIRAAEEWDTGQKDRYLQKFLDNFAVFRGMMQIMNETRIVSNKKASEIARYTAEIRKQVVDWRRKMGRDSVSPGLNGESIFE